MTDATPTRDDVIAAWQLQIELRTRITTQALDFQDGDEATALKSVYDFFQLARTTLAAHPDGHRTAEVVVRALNQDIRPFTAKWHRISLAGDLGSADTRVRFRDELSRLQELLTRLGNDLAAIVGIAPSPLPARPSAEEPLPAAAPLPFGVPPAGDPATRDRIAAMNRLEAEDVKARRHHYKLADAELPVDAVGLALSGGGIRSSTLCLGVLQVLGRQGMLKQVDFLSTVSGGGYVGSFLTTAMGSQDTSVSLDKEAAPFGWPAGTEHPLIRRLRNHSKYLSEGGSRTLLTTVFTLLFGLWSSLMLLLPVLMVLALLMSRNLTGTSTSPGTLTPVAFAAILAWGLLAAGALALGMLRNRPAAPVLQGNLEKLLFAALALSALCGIPPVYHVLKGHEWPAIGLIATLACLFAVIEFRARAGSPLGRAGLIGLSVSGPLLFLAALLACISLVDWLPMVVAARISAPGASTPFILNGIWIALGIIVGLYALFGVDINFASLHRYYRDRLARTYLLQAVDNKPDGEPMQDLRLSPGLTLGEAEGAHSGKPPDLRALKGPVHLINAALNVPGSRNPGLRGRNADFFTFGRHYCGSALTGWYPTTEWEKLDAHLDVGTAMAISGAAASPNRGTADSARYRPLLAVLNVRLGYWLRRPIPGSGLQSHRWPPISLYYFLSELLGWMREDMRCINVSDGGHIENLGIYELLRRRCRYVIAIDAECDPGHAFGSLLTLIRFASIDFGIRIDPKLSDLRLGRNGWTNGHFMVTRFQYADGTTGTLLYIKSSMTGNESAVLKSYRDGHPDFPHESTAQQLFGEPQWEAYRALGEHIGEALFDRGLLGADAPESLPEWLSLLTRRIA